MLVPVAARFKKSRLDGLSTTLIADWEGPFMSESEG